MANLKLTQNMRSFLDLTSLSLSPKKIIMRSAAVGNAIIVV